MVAHEQALEPVVYCRLQQAGESGLAEPRPPPQSRPSNPCSMSSTPCTPPECPALLQNAKRRDATGLSAGAPRLPNKDLNAL